MATEVAQRNYITAGFTVNDGHLVRPPMVGEAKGTSIRVCSMLDAINEDEGKLENAGARFIDNLRLHHVPSGQIFVRPFVVNERVGVYVALAASNLESEGKPTSFSSWYDLYAAPEEADGLQEKVGTRN